MFKVGLENMLPQQQWLKCIKNNHPGRQLIVVGVWTEIFQNLPFVDRVYQIGNTSYFYQTYVENQDSLLFANEPYFTTDHIHKKLPLVQTWKLRCMG